MLFGEENKKSAISDEELEYVTGGFVGTGATVTDAPYPLNTFPIVNAKDSCPHWCCSQHDSSSCICTTIYSKDCERCKHYAGLNNHNVCNHPLNRVN